MSKPSATLTDWLRAAAKSAPGGDVAALDWVTPEGITVKPLYTRLQDMLPAMEAAAAAGIRHFEFGGGARFQAPYFYLGENPFDCMDRMRSAVEAPRPTFRF